MGRVTKAQATILRAIVDRPLDVFDLSDAVGINPRRMFTACKALRTKGLVDWMYGEDEVALSIAGRLALSEGKEAGTNE